ncbi:Protein bicaudal C -like protein 1-B [Takifugu flavidus]|uniref:Protein bicaudal C-like protein 1-B n=1 Tax=Takifugu flavidus TaxID=433684 RepID=A0A5C6PEP7_9TELE|nr:Protein bicaudal C -like protein 1-B [Takifugu flavidus]
MAAQCDSLSGYLPQSDHGSNSECSADSPLPGSEDDLSGPQPLPDPEWTEERFRVDRKKLEIMLLGSLSFVLDPHLKPQARPPNTLC